MRAALGGVVVLALLGVGAAVVATVATPGGEVVAVPAGSGGAADGALEGTEPGVDGFGGAPVVVLHVLGAVADPGIVELPPGSRVVDAIAAAGGPTDEADLAAVNLARVVVDGEQLRLPAVGEAPAAGVPGAGPGSGSDGAGPGSASVAADGRININTADAAGLEQLPGVGPAIAARIIAWREQNGPFRSVDELTAVSGIGEKTLDGLRDQATV